MGSKAESRSVNEPGSLPCAICRRAAARSFLRDLSMPVRAIEQSKRFFIEVMGGGRRRGVIRKLGFHDAGTDFL